MGLYEYKDRTVETERLLSFLDITTSLEVFIIIVSQILMWIFIEIKMQSDDPFVVNKTTGLFSTSHRNSVQPLSQAFGIDRKYFGIIYGCRDSLCHGEYPKYLNSLLQIAADPEGFDRVFKLVGTDYNQFLRGIRNNALFRMMPKATQVENTEECFKTAVTKWVNTYKETHKQQ